MYFRDSAQLPSDDEVEAVSVLTCLPILAGRGRAVCAKRCYDSGSCLSTFFVNMQAIFGPTYILCVE
jgi:hypothetical protein